MGRNSRRAPAGRPHQQDGRREQQKVERMLPVIRGREIDLGDLSGVEVEQVIAHFRYFGAEIRVNPDLNETMLIDLIEDASEIAVDDPMQVVGTKDFVRDHIHPDDFDTFWGLVVKHRQEVRDLMKLCHLILEQVTERPTSPPSDSSDGRPDTRENSPGGASAPVAGRSAREVAQTFVEEFEAEGRPDKANFVMLAVEAREARGLVTV